QPTHLVHPALETLCGSGDPEGGDDVAVPAPDRHGDTAQADLELVDGDRPAAAPGPRELSLQRDAVDDGLRGQPLEAAARSRQRGVGVEHLAECRGMRRYVDLGPVAGAEHVLAVDLADLDHPVAL